MNINETYAVFGLGRYGRAVAVELLKSGAEVLAVDSDEALVRDAASEIPVCKCADITDPYVIEKLGIGSIDVVVIAMASNLEASVMAITLCKEAGVKKVVAKCANEMHKKIYERVGADKVVFPENESGIRLAKNLISAGFIDIIDFSDDVSIIEADVKKEWIGKNLMELNFRKKYSVNVVSVIKDGQVIIAIDPEMPFEEDMKLIVIGNTSKLNKVFND